MFQEGMRRDSDTHDFVLLHDLVKERFMFPKGDTVRLYRPAYAPHLVLCEGWATMADGKTTWRVCRPDANALESLFGPRALALPVGHPWPHVDDDQGR